MEIKEKIHIEKFECKQQNKIFPTEIINEILCYLINDHNYIDLILLSKCIYNYFVYYFKPLLAKSCTQQYTININLPGTININKKYDGHKLFNIMNNPKDNMQWNRQYCHISKYTINELFTYDAKYKPIDSKLFNFIHDMVNDKIKYQNGIFLTGINDYLLEEYTYDHNDYLHNNTEKYDADGNYIHFMFNSYYELIDFINKHGGNVNILNKNTIENISEECYAKMRDTFISDYESSHKDIQFYVFYDIYQKNIELKLIQLKNMIKVYQILDIEIKQEHNMLNEGYSLGYINYVGHIYAHNQKVPVYSVSYDH